VARLQEAMRRGAAQTALEALEALSDCSANVAASHLMELCSQLANQRNPVKDYGATLSALVEAHQSLTRELEELYPACRMKTW
jgi:translation initiation factor 2B subunit (eIF-2B alpha/beta/delta family)